MFAAALVVESGAASVGAVVRAFGLDDSTLFRARERFREGGIEALVPKKRGRPVGQTVEAAVVSRIVALRGEGLSPERIGERLGLSRGRVRRVLAREGVPKEIPETLPLIPAMEPAQAPEASVQVGPAPEKKECSAEPASTSEPIAPPATQEIAAVYAGLGATPDGEAEVVFETRANVPMAGALLMAPALEATGLLECSRTVYGRLRPGIYGLRATIFVLALLAILRRPRPEALKGLDPSALGDVLGLLRAPEVKTVRRKLAEIEAAGKSHALIRELAKRWLQERDDALGVLYVDGHVRVYDGKHKLPKAHVTQKNLCLPATTDYWVNDVAGSPVFVVTPPANAAMTKVLPGLLSELEELGNGRKGTVVFDRGGWSQPVFKSLLDAGWQILTYRKGKRTDHELTSFKARTARIDGRDVTYTLSERTVELSSGLKLREIAELRDDGGQTHVMTSDFKSDPVLLAHRMFGRWRQENYFRYMKENFALDALAGYGVEADDPLREVPNPARKILDKKINEVRATLVGRERAYGAAAADNQECERPSMRGFKIANGKLGQSLREARDQLAALINERRALPKRCPVGEVLDPTKVVRLSPERKTFTDAIKAATYRAESALFALLRPHFKRAEDEGRAFLRTVCQLPADLVVTGEHVVVRFAPMSAPRFTAALRALCDSLNALNPRFPETRYYLRYEVAEPTKSLT
jgi:hypothetical protein